MSSPPVARRRLAAAWLAIAAAITCLALGVAAIVGACHSSSRPGAQRFDDDHAVTINGTLLHYRVRGWNRANPYLVILHGGPGASALELYPWGEAYRRSVRGSCTSASRARSS